MHIAQSISINDDVLLSTTMQREQKQTLSWHDDGHIFSIPEGMFVNVLLRISQELNS